MAERAAQDGQSHEEAGRSRALAARLLHQVRGGHSLTTLFAEGLSGVTGADKSLVKELCFGVCRYWFQLEAIASQLLKRPLKARDQDLQALVLIGLYQLRYTRVAPHAAISETVAAARRLHKPWATGLINALLRRFQRDQARLLQAASEQPEARYACPSWLLRALKESWPQAWEEIAESLLQRPPMALRVNLRRVSRANYFERLRSASIPARPIPGVASGLLLDQALGVAELPGFEQGLVSVQDGGAQLAAGLLDPKPGQRVLDACAAPGGKSGHILEAAAPDCRLTALDIDTDRLGLIHQNLRRLGLSAEVCQGDAANPSGTWSERRYQRILLDVPCSASGVIRRHPDIKLLRKPGDISRLAETQQRILASVWPLLEPGGVLLYATCSLLSEENERQIEHFLGSQPDARELPIEADWGRARAFGRQTLLGESGMDGFYYARLTKV